MENASKAILIVAAIIVTLSVIALGMYFFNAMDRPDVGGQMSELEVQTHNKKFENYEGTSVSGSKVNSLLKLVVQNNTDVDRKTEQNKSIKITISSANWDGGTVKSGDNLKTTKDLGKAKSTRNYKVSLDYNSTSGYVSEVIIGD